MRLNILGLLVLIVAIGGMACNSRETFVSQIPKGPTPAQTPQHPPADGARRITAQDLHQLWQEGEVLVIDTRNELAYKDGHIKGAILIPAGDFLTKADELPRDKMIVTYCT